jgi:hypothetical protein
MLILIDQDGVLADFDRGFYDAWQASGHAHPAVEPQHRRNFYVKDDYPKEIQSDAIDIITAKGFLKTCHPLMVQLNHSINYWLQGMMYVFAHHHSTFTKIACKKNTNG